VRRCGALRRGGSRLTAHGPLQADGIYLFYDLSRCCGRPTLLCTVSGSPARALEAKTDEDVVQASHPARSAHAPPEEREASERTRLPRARRRRAG